MGINADLSSAGSGLAAQHGTELAQAGPLKGAGLAELSGGVIGGEQEPAGCGFIGGRDQHANTLRLQRRILSSGIVCRHCC